MEEAPAPAGPRFEGTSFGFAMLWVGATLGAVFLAWIVQSVMFTAALSGAYRNLGPFGYRLVNVVFSTFVYGGGLGMIQAGVLKRSLDGRSTRWLEATLAGYFLSGLARLLQPEASLQDRSLETMLLWAGVYGVLGGTAMGVFQAMALGKLGAGSWLLRWTPVSIAANTLGALTGTAVYHGLFQGQAPVRSIALAGISRTMVHALLTSLPAGLFLGHSLCRHFGTHDESPTE
jgi:hypothetical protein